MCGCGAPEPLGAPIAAQKKRDAAMERLTNWLKRVGGFVVNEGEAKDEEKNVNALPEKKLFEACGNDRLQPLGARNGACPGTADDLGRTIHTFQKRRYESAKDKIGQADGHKGMSNGSGDHNPYGDGKDEMIGLGEQAPPFRWLVFFREADGQRWRIVARSPGK